MNALEATLRRLPRDLKSAGVPWTLVGGFAVSCYAGGRATADVDVAVAVDTEPDVDSLVYALRRLGYQPGAVLADSETGQTATVRMYSPDGEHRPIFVDLLIATSGLEPEVVRASAPKLVLPGLRLNVARLGHLIALKVLSESDERLQDRIDLRTMLAVAQPSDLQLAEDGLRLIQARGRARGKDLFGRLDEFRRA